MISFLGLINDPQVTTAEQVAPAQQVAPAAQRQASHRVDRK